VSVKSTLVEEAFPFAAVVILAAGFSEGSRKVAE
jgi:hypothetical protein